MGAFQSFYKFRKISRAFSKKPGKSQTRKSIQHSPKKKQKITNRQIHKISDTKNANILKYWNFIFERNLLINLSSFGEFQIFFKFFYPGKIFLQIKQKIIELEIQKMGKKKGEISKLRQKTNCERISGCHKYFSQPYITRLHTKNL